MSSSGQALSLPYCEPTRCRSCTVWWHRGLLSFSLGVFNLFSQVNQLPHLCFCEGRIFQIAQQCHDPRLVMEKINNIRVSRRRKAVKHVRIGSKCFRQCFDYFRARRSFFSSFYPAQICWRNSDLAGRFTQAKILSDSEVAYGVAKTIHGKNHTPLFSVMQHITLLVRFSIKQYHLPFPAIFLSAARQ